MRTLFRVVSLRLARSARGRWVLAALLLLVGAGLFALLPAAHGTNERLSFLIGGAFFVAFGLFVLIFAILISRGTAKAMEEGEARAKQMLAEGTLVPIPPLPKSPPKGATPDDLAQVERYAGQLSTIPWGAHPQVAETNVYDVFNSTVAYTRRITGDWAQLSGPVQTFANLPLPLAYVGAAEVMFRLSYLRGTTYAPVGLRQGVRFTTRAQLHTPLQPDALVIQIKLLAACRYPYWQELATKTVALAQRAAPNHPRLANSLMFYHRMRGEYDEALRYADQAISHPPSPEEAQVALSSKSLLLMDLKRYPEGIAACDALLAQNPNDPWCWHNRSIMLARMGNYPEALASSERALSIMEFGAARKQRAAILSKLAEG